jgi:hypothetical protein
MQITGRRAGCRGQGCAGWRQRRALLNRRPIGRFFVVSIEEGSRKANRLPASGRARWPSAPGERDADHRQPIGLPVVKGVSDGARFGPCSIVARSGGSSWSRLRKAPTRRTGYQRRAVLGGHRHQANAMQITGSRSGCPWSRVCRLAPASGRARWRSRASGARSNAMQITGSRSGCPWSRVCRLAPASGRARWPSAPGERDSDLSGHRGRAVARSKVMQGSGRRSGCPWSRVCRMAPASGRAQWPSAPGERDSDLSGDRWRAVPRSKVMQGSGRRSGCPWSRVCRLAPASGRAQWPSRASGSQANAMQITGSRSGCPWSRVCRMAPASGRAQSSPDQPVLRGLD